MFQLHILSNLNAVIQQQASDYVARLFDLASERGLKIWFQGIPAPNLDWKLISNEDRVLLIDVIQKYNAAMKIASEEKGCRFVDVYALTAGEDGTSNQKWHLDAHHLRPDYLQQLFFTS